MLEKQDSQWEEEKTIWAEAALGNEDAREQLILAYRPLVYWTAKKFRVTGTRFADLVQEGMLALISAVDKFDISLGRRFTTYACYKIRGQMLNYLQRVEAKAPIPVDFEEESCEDRVAEFSEIEEIITLREGLLHLPEREARILSELVVECRNAKELAHEYSLDVSQIYRLKKKAFQRLREWFFDHDSTNEASGVIIK